MFMSSGIVQLTPSGEVRITLPATAMNWDPDHATPVKALPITDL
jgi:hypothetical protein